MIYRIITLGLVVGLIAFVSIATLRNEIINHHGIHEIGHHHGTP